MDLETFNGERPPIVGMDRVAHSGVGRIPDTLLGIARHRREKQRDIFN